MGFAMSSCGGGAEALADGLEDLENEMESNAMTCAEVVDQADDLEGQEITIKAISWGSNGTTTGVVQLSLGDEKLEGMQQAHAVAVFSEADAAVAEGVAKDAEVTIKATVGETSYGAVHLTNPSIVK